MHRRNHHPASGKEKPGASLRVRSGFDEDLLQDAEQVQSDDDDQRNARQPQNEIACHSILLRINCRSSS
jgi:hypothetical protein